MHFKFWSILTGTADKTYRFLPKFSLCGFHLWANLGLEGDHLWEVWAWEIVNLGPSGAGGTAVGQTGRLRPASRHLQTPSHVLVIGGLKKEKNYSFSCQYKSHNIAISTGYRYRTYISGWERLVKVVNWSSGSKTKSVGTHYNFDKLFIVEERLL